MRSSSRRGVVNASDCLALLTWNSRSEFIDITLAGTGGADSS